MKSKKSLSFWKAVVYNRTSPGGRERPGEKETIDQGDFLYE